MGSTQSKDYVPTPRFLSVSEDDIVEMKEMIEHRLETRTILAQFAETLVESSEGMEEKVKHIEKGVQILRKESDGQLIKKMKFIGEAVELFAPYFIIATKIITMLLQFHDETEAIQEKLLNQKIDLKIDHAQIKYAISTLKSDINTINNRINQIQNDNISAEQRRLELTLAFDRCEVVLSNFENPNHVLYLNPLITAPWLVTYAQLYLSIIMIVTQFIPTYAEHAVREKRRLKKVLEDYKENTIQGRFKMIKIVKTFEKKDRYYVDVVIDDFGYHSKIPGEKHNWDRELQQGSIHNHSYKSAVRITYEKFFDRFIVPMD